MVTFLQYCEHTRESVKNNIVEFWVEIVRYGTTSKKISVFFSYKTVSVHLRSGGNMESRKENFNKHQNLKRNVELTSGLKYLRCIVSEDLV